MKSLTLLGATAVMVLCLSACGGPGGVPGNDGRHGAVAVSLPVSAGDVTRVQVLVTPPAAEDPQWTIDQDIVLNGSNAQGVIFGIPAGTDRLFTVNAYVNTAVVCTGSATADVLANQTVSLTMLLQCIDPDGGTGGVIIDGHLNFPPVITSIFVSDVDVNAFDTVLVRVTATDPDGDPITYAWTATCGGFADSTASETTWTAPSTGGTCTITVTVTDNLAGSRSMSVDITVTAIVVGGGTYAVKAGRSGNILDSGENGFGVASLPDGSVLVTGRYHDGALFGSSTVLSDPNTNGAAFVAKYDPSGGLVWVRTLIILDSTVLGETFGWDIAAFNDGSSVVTGRFTGLATFAPGQAAEVSVTASGDSDGDGYAVLLNSDGTMSSLVFHGATGSDGPVVDTFPDGSGFVVADDFIHSITIGNVTETAPISGYYLARFDRAGNLLWHKSSSTGYSYPTSVSIGNGGTVFVSGNIAGTGGTETFGADEGNPVTLGVGGYVLKYTSAGSLVWARQVMLDQWNSPAGNAGPVAAASDGSIRVATNFGGLYPLVIKYDSSGNSAWTSSLVTGLHSILALAVKPNGDTVAVGEGNQTLYTTTVWVTCGPSGDSYGAAVFTISDAGSSVAAKCPTGVPGYSPSSGDDAALLGDGTIVVTGGFYGTVGFDTTVLVNNKYSGTNIFVWRTNP